MILILGGTTEGRVAVRVADEAAATYYYSTKKVYDANGNLKKKNEGPSSLLLTLTLP